ncbi:MAG: hypothetical protein GX682_04330 [Clostridiaceae bacterium]|nr:hypothetical protein [Clostridiaceae bacterium]
MKKKEIQIICVLVILSIIILTTIIIIKNNKDKHVFNIANQQNNIKEQEEFVQVLKDETKLNSSVKLKEEKTINY